MSEDGRPGGRAEEQSGRRLDGRTDGPGRQAGGQESGTASRATARLPVCPSARPKGA